ncbi:MAG: hypothetical protein V8S01_01690 [Dorea sp.]
MDYIRKEANGQLAFIITDFRAFTAFIMNLLLLRHAKSEAVHLFKPPGHMITEELYQYTRDLTVPGVYTNKEVAELRKYRKEEKEGGGGGKQRKRRRERSVLPIQPVFDYFHIVKTLTKGCKRSPQRRAATTL